MKDSRIEILGFNIRVMRMKNKMTQSQLAELSGISVDSIQKIENGKQTPSALVIFDIANVLNVPIEELYKDIDKSSNK